MCIALFLFDVHPSLLFLLVFNRDEFYNRCLLNHRLSSTVLARALPDTRCHRPTKEAHFWEDKPDILAGRDLVGGGTWLGVTRSGRFAFLTNFREASHKAP